MELQREPITYHTCPLHRIVLSTAEGDVIVPDSKPDIHTILQVTATPHISDVDVLAGRISVQGMVDFTILYRPDGDPSKVESIPATFPFAETLEDSALSSDMTVSVRLATESAVGKLQNSRKLSVCAKIQLTLSADCAKEADAICQIPEQEESVEYLSAEVETCHLCIGTFCPFGMEEVLDVPSGNPAISEIHAMDVCISPGESKAIQNKIVWKATALITTIYTGSDESVSMMEHEIPITEILDVADMEEDMIFGVDPNLESIAYRLEGDNRQIAVSIQWKIGIAAWKTETLSCITDAYCPRKNFQAETGTLPISCPIAEREENISRRETLVLSESEPPISRILNCRAEPVILRTQVGDGYVDVEGKLLTSILYFAEGEEESIASIGREIPFTERINLPSAKEGMRADVSSTLTHVSYTMVSREEVECRFNLLLTIFVIAEKSIPYLADAKITDETPSNRPSVIISFAGEGDTLWSIAKNYNIPMDDLLAANDIKEDTPVIGGMQFLIPR